MNARPVLLTFCLAVAVCGGACKRKKAPQPELPAPAAAPVAGTAPPQPGQPSPVPQEVATTREAQVADAYIQEMSQTLNDFLADYIRQHKRVPKDINEMVSLKLITSVPVLPAGKKWVIDQQTGKIFAR